tara:strand:+ start:1031 stop:1375 length:345 start_codon:yes stop_codon:yes gene_type:complete
MSMNKIIQDLVNDLREMDEMGAIELDMWPKAQALIDEYERSPFWRASVAAGEAHPHDALIRKSAQAIIDWGGALAEDYAESILEEIIPAELGNDIFWEIARKALALAQGMEVSE